MTEDDEYIEGATAAKTALNRAFMCGDNGHSDDVRTKFVYQAVDELARAVDEKFEELSQGFAVQMAEQTKRVIRELLSTGHVEMQEAEQTSLAQESTPALFAEAVRRAQSEPDLRDLLIRLLQNMTEDTDDD